MTKEPLLISFSGGATSAYMTHLLLQDEYIRSHFDIHIVFANTGFEHEKTLEFVRNCESKLFRKPVVWLEAVINPEKGMGTRYKIVNFETASRHAEPFRAMVAKYTMPNVANRHCTRELKKAPIEAWLRDKFGRVNVPTAIGIRADEMRRVKDGQRKLMYPLVYRYPSDKQDVDDFWAQQDFALGLPAYLGNCVPCFQKTDGKLLKALHEAPEYFDILCEIERDFPNGRDGQPVHFFRKKRHSDDLREMLNAIDMTQQQLNSQFGTSCGESCEFLNLE